MTAKQNFSEFDLDVVLTKLSQVETVNIENKKLTIDLDCGIDDVEQVKKYKDVLKFLHDSKIISKLKNTGEIGYITDNECPPFEFERYFYTPNFYLNQKELTKFLLATSRIPKYSLSMDETGKVNKPHLLAKVEVGFRLYKGGGVIEFSAYNGVVRIIK